MNIHEFGKLHRNASPNKDIKNHIETAIPKIPPTTLGDDPIVE